MIQKLDISGVHFEVGEDLKKYVAKKIGRLDRYLPRQARESIHAEVKLKEGKAGGKQNRTCEVIMRLPQDTITLKETTINAFAAVDIAEAKLKNQLKRYKETHTGPRLHQRFLARIKRTTDFR